MKQTIILSGGLGNQMFQYAFFFEYESKREELFFRYDSFSN